MHADIAGEIESRAAETRAQQQLACDEWRVEFNHVRPHEALEMKTPADVYRPSSRRAVVQSGALRRDCQRRTVDSRGLVSWNLQRIYVTVALSGHTVGLRREGEVIAVWFYKMRIGTFRYGIDKTLKPAESKLDVGIANGAADAHSALLGDSSADGPAPKDAAAPEAALADVMAGALKLDCHPVTPKGLLPGDNAQVSPGVTVQMQALSGRTEFGPGGKG
jgi:hypothetical protein